MPRLRPPLMKEHDDINDTFRNEGEEAARRRHDQAKTYKANGKGQHELLPYIDIARSPIPPRPWLVPNKIPGRNVTLISGEGGRGKSLLMKQLSAATVLARDWIGLLPAAGPVIYLNCEDDSDEICHRLEAIADH